MIHLGAFRNDTYGSNHFKYQCLKGITPVLKIMKLVVACCSRGKQAYFSGWGMTTRQFHRMSQ